MEVNLVVDYLAQIGCFFIFIICDKIYDTHIIYDMAGKSSTQLLRFLSDVCQFFQVLTYVRSRLEKKLNNVKCSSGHVECIFDNPAEIFLPKYKIFSLIVRK